MALYERLPEICRREALRVGGAGMMALAGADLLAACGGSGTTSTASGASSAGGPPVGGKPVRGGTLTVGMITGGLTETVIAGHATAESDLFRCQQLYDGLFWLGPNERTVPFLAESAEPNASGTVWTIKVRSGVTWHDGKPLTAADVVASIKSWHSPNNYYGGQLTRVIDFAAVRARGPLTVEVPCKIAIADLPGLVAEEPFYITRPNVYDKGVTPVGTGPFKYQSFIPGRHSVFVANKDYWGLHGGPYVDKLVVDSSFSDDTARLNALLSGSIDIAPGLPPALARANAASNQIYLGTARGANAYYFACRVDLKPFMDPRVMQALKMLVNRPQMVTSVFDGYATQSNDLGGSGLQYFAGPEVFPIRQHDPERAKSLLKTAGYHDLRITLYTSAVFAGFVQAATAYAQQAAAGGVTVRVVTVDPSIYYTSQGPGGGYYKYPMMTSTPGGGSFQTSLTEYYLENFWTGAPTPETHFGNPHTDKLLFDAIGEMDPAKRQEKWNAIQGAVYETGGQIIFGNSEYLDGYGRNVRGVRTEPSGYVNNFNVTRAWLT